MKKSECKNDRNGDSAIEFLLNFNLKKQVINKIRLPGPIFTLLMKIWNSLSISEPGLLELICILKQTDIRTYCM